MIWKPAMWSLVFESSSSFALMSTDVSVNLKVQICVSVFVSMSETPAICSRSLRTEAAHPTHVMPGSFSFTKFTSPLAGVVAVAEPPLVLVDAVVPHPTNATVKMTTAPAQRFMFQVSGNQGSIRPPSGERRQAGKSVGPEKPGRNDHARSDVYPSPTGLTASS